MGRAHAVTTTLTISTQGLWVFLTVLHHVLSVAQADISGWTTYGTHPEGLHVLVLSSCCAVLMRILTNHQHPYPYDGLMRWCMWCGMCASSCTSTSHGRGSACCWWHSTMPQQD